MKGTFNNMNHSIYCSMDLFADLEGRKEIYREDVLDTWDGLLNLEEIQQVCYPLWKRIILSALFLFWVLFAEEPINSFRC